MSQIQDPRLLDDFKQSHRFGALVQPGVGLIDDIRMLPVRLGEAEVEVIGASLGNLSRAFPYVTTEEERTGAGSDTDLELAWIRAVVEAAERYASMVYSERDFVVGSARDLGADAIDLETLPRCSEREYSDPRCPLRRPDLDQEIRWVRGYSLIDRIERFIPAVMTHLYMEPWESERFWLQISTGLAAHTSLEAALIGAICETIERDALALTWLGRLHLPRLQTPNTASPELDTVLSRARASVVAFHNFDATTDLGIPTVLSIQLSDGHPYCDVSLSCATALDPEAALKKALCEGTSARLALDRPLPIPKDVMDFIDLTHGAHYYGLGGHRDDLDFLLGSHGVTTSPAMVGSPLGVGAASDPKRLEALLGRLREHQMDVIAIDLSTDELRDVGLWAVRVLVPQLMPISFVHRARFLATPRLFGYVTRHTGAKFKEVDVNPAPLPFA